MIKENYNSTQWLDKWIFGNISEKRKWIFGSNNDSNSHFKLELVVDEVPAVTIYGNSFEEMVYQAMIAWDKYQFGKYPTQNKPQINVSLTEKEVGVILEAMVCYNNNIDPDSYGTELTFVSSKMMDARKKFKEAGSG